MEQLQKVFCDVFDVSKEMVGPEFSPSSCPTWDSFHHVVLIVAIEKEYGVKLTMKEAVTIDTFQKTYDLISQKIGNK
jgi:acyl carrier protein